METKTRGKAGFRSPYSTLDHLQAMNQLMEKPTEYDILYLAFVNYKKPIDSEEQIAILNSLRKQGENEQIGRVLEKVYAKGICVIRLHKDTENIKIKKRVRQGDTISPKLFISCLEEIFRKLSWEEKGLKINGEYFNHLRFPDVIILITGRAEHFYDFLNYLSK